MTTIVTLPGTTYRGLTGTVESVPTKDGSVNIGTNTTKDFDTDAVGVLTNGVEHEVDLSTIRGPRRQKVFREVDALRNAGVLVDAGAGGDAPDIDTVAVTTGTGVEGDTITITGENFEGTADVVFIDSEGNEVTVVNGSLTSISTTEIVVDIPAGLSGGLCAVKVTDTEADVTLPDAFSVLPDLLSIAPTGGSTAGGEPVTLGGTGFADGATVTIGGEACTNVVYVDNTEITADTPAGSVGAEDVVVTNPDTNADTLVGGFTYS